MPGADYGTDYPAEKSTNSYVTGKDDRMFQIRRFCDEVHPGDAVTGLEYRARSLGLEVVDLPAPPDGSRRAALSAWQGFSFARTFCNVEYEAGHVTDAQRTFVD